MLSDLIREISQTLRHNKLRTALTGFAVAWGIFLLIILLGLSRGITNNFERWQSSENSSSVTVWGGITSKPYKGYKTGRQIELKESDIRAIIEDNSPGTAGVAATKRIDTATIATGRDYISQGLTGVFPSTGKKQHIEMISGRFINDADINSGRKVIVLRDTHARQLFGSETAATGRRVKGMGLSWLIVGVYSHPWERSAYIPFTTAINLSGGDSKVSEMSVTAEGLTTIADGEKFEEGIRSTLARVHSFDASDLSAVYVWNRFTNYLQQKTAGGILNTSVWILGFLTLLSGIVGVSNIMFVSVRERTHEIGIRRAIGAKPRHILTQIVAESAAITTLFGYIGVVGGMIVLAVIDSMFGNSDFMQRPGVDLTVALQVTIVLIIAGSIAGLFPAIKATKVKPVEALRYE